MVGITTSEEALAEYVSENLSIGKSEEFLGGGGHVIPRGRY